MLKKSIQLSIVVLLFLSISSVVIARDLKVEEILAKHLDSIGTREKRDWIKNRMVAGTSQFASKLPERKTGGKGVIVSDPNNLWFVTSFLSQEYPYEKIGYFSEKISLPFVTAGTRSPLGAFINDHSKMLSNGLFTGSISSNWVLLSAKRKGSFDSAGTKNVNGRKAYALNYFTGDSSTEFTIKMFFDTETFQHIRTEYRHVIAPKTAKFGQLGEQSGVILSVTEDFSDFKTVDGLTFPYTYRIKYLTDSNTGTAEWTWGINVQQYLFNQNLTPDFFTFDTK